MPDPVTTTDPRPVARSPITLPRVRVPPPGGPTLSDLSLLAKVAVRAPATGGVPDALDVGVGRAARPTDGPLAGMLVVGSGPGQWLVVGSGDDDSRRLLAAVDAILVTTDQFATRVDVGHGRALLRLTGAQAPALLAKLCAIDLRDRFVPNGAAFRSSVARVVTDVVRDDTGGGPAGRSYLIHCERSSSQYLTDALIDAGREFGLCTRPTPQEGRRTR